MHRLEINGTRGRVVVEDMVRRFTCHAAGRETAQAGQAGYFNDRDHGFHRTLDRHVDALLAAFRRGDPPPIHAEAGRRALALAEAAIQSFAGSRRVAVASPPVENAVTAALRPRTSDRGLAFGCQGWQRPLRPQRCAQAGCLQRGL